MLSRKTLKKAVYFLLKYDDQTQLRTIKSVYPYSGSLLDYHAINSELLDSSQGCSCRRIVGTNVSSHHPLSLLERSPTIGDRQRAL